MTTLLHGKIISYIGLCCSCYIPLVKPTFEFYHYYTPHLTILSPLFPPFLSNMMIQQGLCCVVIARFFSLNNPFLSLSLSLTLSVFFQLKFHLLLLKTLYTSFHFTYPSLTNIFPPPFLFHRFSKKNIPDALKISAQELAAHLNPEGPIIPL